MDLNALSRQVSKAALNVHKILGPGLLEAVYLCCMVIELEHMHLKVQSEAPLVIFYRGQRVHSGRFHMDLLVEDTLVVELEITEKIQDSHRKQLLTYLRLANKPLGLLINFTESVEITAFPGFNPYLAQTDISSSESLNLHGTGEEEVAPRQVSI